MGKVTKSMKTLVIDSHKSGRFTPQENLHWVNARQIADHLGADLIWSYPTVNSKVSNGYDRIIFHHASAYSYTDYEWIEKNSNAKLFYIVNEYNLGEPRTLWMAATQEEAKDISELRRRAKGL